MLCHAMSAPAAPARTFNPQSAIAFASARRRPLAADLRHAAADRQEAILQPVPPRLAPDPLADRRAQLLVARAPADERPQVELVGPQQAQPQLPVRGQAHPVAAGAEVLGDRADEADRAPR